MEKFNPANIINVSKIPKLTKEIMDLDCFIPGWNLNVPECENDAIGRRVIESLKGSGIYPLFTLKNTFYIPSYVNQFFNTAKHVHGAMDPLTGKADEYIWAKIDGLEVALRASDLGKIVPLPTIGDLEPSVDRIKKVTQALIGESKLTNLRKWAKKDFGELMDYIATLVGKSLCCKNGNHNYFTTTQYEYCVAIYTKKELNWSEILFKEICKGVSYFKKYCGVSPPQLAYRTHSRLITLWLLQKEVLHEDAKVNQLCVGISHLNYLSNFNFQQFRSKNGFRFYRAAWLSDYDKEERQFKLEPYVGVNDIYFSRTMMLFSEPPFDSLSPKKKSPKKLRKKRNLTSETEPVSKKRRRFVLGDEETDEEHEVNILRTPSPAAVSPTVSEPRDFAERLKFVWMRNLKSETEPASNKRRRFVLGDELETDEEHELNISRTPSPAAVSPTVSEPRDSTERSKFVRNKRNHTSETEPVSKKRWRFIERLANRSKKNTHSEPHDSAEKAYDRVNGQHEKVTKSDLTTQLNDMKIVMGNLLKEVEEMKKKEQKKKKFTLVEDSFSD